MDEIPVYWKKPYLFELDTIVSKARQTEKGRELILEQTPFYPGGGGQPADRGSINGINITGLRKENGSIIHELNNDDSGNFFTDGEKVHCQVDEDFRLDSMAQHSGQHLLSSALSREGLDTVSVHLGSEYVGIEVEGTESGRISEETINRVLDYCSHRISENRRIISHYLNPEELKDLKLRRPVKGNSDLVRIVEIESLDHVGCGGVHLEGTAGIRQILYLGSEKIRGRTRLKWLIGKRAELQARKLMKQNQLLQNILSAGSDEIPGKIETILKENRGIRAEIKKLAERTGNLLAESWISGGEKYRFIAETIDAGTGGRDCLEAAVRRLVDSEISGAFLLSEGSWIFFSREGDPFSAFNDGVLSAFNGRGGGKPPLWRGRIEGDEEQIIQEVRRWFETRRNR